MRASPVGDPEEPDLFNLCPSVHLDKQTLLQSSASCGVSSTETRTEQSMQEMLSELREVNGPALFCIRYDQCNKWVQLRLLTISDAHRRKALCLSCLNIDVFGLWRVCFLTNFSLKGIVHLEIKNVVIYPPLCQSKPVLAFFQRYWKEKEKKKKNSAVLLFI